MLHHYAHQLLFCTFQPHLNEFMGLGRPAWQEARGRLQQLLSVECNELKGNADLLSRYILMVKLPVFELHLHRELCGLT